MSALARTLPGMRQGLLDILGLLGFAALMYGLWLIWHPLPWCVGGLLALGFALKASRSTPAPDGP